jgi:hypothetical protein
MRRDDERPHTFTGEYRQAAEAIEPPSNVRGAMTVGHWLLVFGFGCLAVVNLFPVMGWGLPDSPGHYLDLTSAVLGTVLLIADIVLGVYWRRPR